MHRWDKWHGCGFSVDLFRSQDSSLTSIRCWPNDSRALSTPSWPWPVSSGTTVFLDGVCTARHDTAGGHSRALRYRPQRGGPRQAGRVTRTVVSLATSFSAIRRLTGTQSRNQSTARIPSVDMATKPRWSLSLSHWPRADRGGTQYAAYTTVMYIIYFYASDLSKFKLIATYSTAVVYAQLGCQSIFNYYFLTVGWGLNFLQFWLVHAVRVSVTHGRLAVAASMDHLRNDEMQHTRTPFPTNSGSNSMWTFR